MSDPKFRLNKKYLVIYLAAMVDPLLILAYNPLVPVLKGFFNVNVELVALSLTFHMLPFAILNLFSGTLSDLYYRPKILTYGLLLSTVGSILGAVSPTIWIFSLSRTIQGVGSALILPVALALIGDSTPNEFMGKAIGLYGVFMGLATTIGPIIGGFLAGIDWRFVPLIVSAYSLLEAFLIRMTFSGGKEERTRDLTRIFVQIKHASRNRNIILLSAAGFSLFFTFQGIQPLISDLLSLTPILMSNEEIGVLFAIVGLIGIFFSFISGIVIDKLGSKKTMALGFFTMLLPQFLLLFATSWWMYAFLLSLLGGFQRFALSSVQTLVIAAIPEARGSASSIFNFARYLGFAVAPALLAAMYVTQGINVVYFLNLALMFSSILLAALIRIDTT